jgi:hypothetical protein
MLAGRADASTDNLLRPHGFKLNVLVGLVSAEFVTATLERAFAANKPVTRVQITRGERWRIRGAVTNSFYRKLAACDDARSAGRRLSSRIWWRPFTPRYCGPGKLVSLGVYPPRHPVDCWEPRVMSPHAGVSLFWPSQLASPAAHLSSKNRRLNGAKGRRSAVKERRCFRSAPPSSAFSERLC